MKITYNKSRVNCPECKRFQRHIGAKGERIGWVCANQGLVNNKPPRELSSALPSAFVITFFGYPLSVFVEDFQGKLLPCRFLRKSKFDAQGMPTKQLLPIENSGKH